MNENLTEQGTNGNEYISTEGAADLQFDPLLDRVALDDVGGTRYRIDTDALRPRLLDDGFVDHSFDILLARKSFSASTSDLVSHLQRLEFHDVAVTHFLEKFEAAAVHLTRVRVRQYERIPRGHGLNVRTNDADMLREAKVTDGRWKFIDFFGSFVATLFVFVDFGSGRRKFVDYDGSKRHVHEPVAFAALETDPYRLSRHTPRVYIAVQHFNASFIAYRSVQSRNVDVEVEKRAFRFVQITMRYGTGFRPVQEYGVVRARVPVQTRRSRSQISSYFKSLSVMLEDLSSVVGTYFYLNQSCSYEA